MSVKYIWGFGGCRLVSGSTTCDLPHAITTLSFEPINRVYTTLNFEQHVINMGFRMRASIEAVNACDTDFAEFQNLVTILNNQFYGGQDITLYPRWSTSDNSLSYNVRCTSGVNFESLAATQAAQRIKLEFESYNAVTQLPTLTSDAAWAYIMTQANENITDQAGNQIIVRI